MPLHKKPGTGGQGTYASAASEKRNKYERFFAGFGVDLHHGMSNSMGDCPFPDCHQHVEGKAGGKFSVNLASGGWDCKYCGRGGYLREFMGYLAEAHFANTDDADYERLVGMRPGITAEVLAEYMVSWNDMLGCFMLPGWSPMDKDGNTCVETLYLWKETRGGKHVVMAPHAVKTYWYGLSEFTKSASPVYICEGQWDYLALHAAATAAGVRDEIDLLGCPGAGTFPKAGLPLLTGRDVCLLADNDDAGRAAVRSLAGSMLEAGVVPAHYSSLHWPKGLKTGYDIRDLIVSGPDGKKPLTPQRTMAWIADNLRQETLDTGSGRKPEWFDGTLEMVECERFGDLMDVCSEVLVMDEAYETTFAVIAACVLSPVLGGPNLWCYHVGPPSSGKTTQSLILAGAQPYVRSYSSVTGILSGYRGKKDASLVADMNGLCNIFKDFTEILDDSKENRMRFFRELRGLYDGSVYKKFRNEVVVDHSNIRFGLICSTTDRIRTQLDTAAGERFFICEIDTSWDEAGHMVRQGADPDDIMMRSIMNVADTVGLPDLAGEEMLKKQKCHAWGLIQHIIDRLQSEDDSPLPAISASSRETHVARFLADHAQWVAMARTKVEKGDDGKLLYRSRSENASRLGTQFSKLAICLALVYGYEEINDRVLKVIRKVAFDSAMGFQAEIMVLLSEYGPQSKQWLAQEMCLGATTVDGYLKDMEAVGIVDHHKKASQVGQGRKGYLYALSERAAALAARCGIGGHGGWALQNAERLARKGGTGDTGDAGETSEPE